MVWTVHRSTGAIAGSQISLQPPPQNRINFSKLYITLLIYHTENSRIKFEACSGYYVHQAKKNTLKSNSKDAIVL